MSRARRHAANWSEAAPLFAALGDETRLRVVARLCEEGPLSIVKLAEGAPVTRQAITKHLVALEDAGLVRAKKHGREKIFELEPRRLKKAHEWLDLISSQWDDAIDRLRAYVEDPPTD